MKQFMLKGLCSLFLTGLMALPVLSQNKWVGTWATSPQLVETRNMPPSPGLTDNTLRQKLCVSIGGDTLRVKFSNAHSTTDVTMQAVNIAVSKGGSLIDESTLKNLTFGGQTAVTMTAGTTVYSDPLAFRLDPRMEVAITIYFGQTSTTVTGHPGSRTTSYILSGNQVASGDFAGAVTTDHWYVINAIDVWASRQTASVAILGNSITDGRGSTTNAQNRWPDIFAQRLLQNESTSQVGVLNYGIGGNCILSGGLGPTAISRYDRDILQSPGIRWAIIYEGVNDIGGSWNTTQTAEKLISAYQQMISAAHAQGIFVYGATIMPFKNNSYYTADREVCRSTVNEWIRYSGAFDAVIDFDKLMRNPSDTASMADDIQDNDYLHPNAAGHRKMGNFVDLDLFIYNDSVISGGTTQQNTSLWIEAERCVGNDTKYLLVEDALASNNKYLKTVENVTSAAPTGTAYYMTVSFNVSKDTLYTVYSRVNCPGWDDDSYWLTMDGGEIVFANGLCSSGWEWKVLGEYVLTAGDHTLQIAGREDGACIDKLCISDNSSAVFFGMGGKDPLLNMESFAFAPGYFLEDCCPNPFVSLKIFNQQGIEMAELAGKKMLHD